MEDITENIDILNGILSSFKRKIATNGERALRIATGTTPPDLILLDIMMPDMDGFEVCRQLRTNKSTRDIPVIFLTAKTAKEDIVKGFEAGGQDYVTKPFDPLELMERVKTQMQLRHQQQMLENMNEIPEQKVQERTIQLEESNNKLEEAFDKLKVLDEAKSNFLKLISHEIRTPLNGIIGSAYFLDDMIDDPELKEFMEMLKESAERLERFAINALFLTQLDTKRQETNLQPVDLNEIVKEVLTENKKIAGEKNIEIIFNIAAVSKVAGDKKLIQKSFSEIITNAIKFSTGSRIQVEITEDKDNQLTTITTRNPSKDISPEKLQRITQAFGLADEHMDKNSGLGLAIAKACQELIKGNLSIENGDGETVVALSYRRM